MEWENVMDDGKFSFDSCHGACQFFSHSPHSSCQPALTHNGRLDMFVLFFYSWLAASCLRAQPHGHGADTRNDSYTKTESRDKRYFARCLAVWMNESIRRTANSVYQVNLMSFPSVRFVFHFKGSISILQVKRWSMEELGATQSVDKSTFS